MSQQTLPKPDRPADLRILAIGGALILLVSGYFAGRSIWFAYSQKQAALKAAATANDAKHPTITADLLRQKIQNHESLAIVDIRPAEAFQSEHIPNSLSLPGGNLTNFPLAEGQILIIISSSEDEGSVIAAEESLRSKKYPYYFLAGGFEDWKASGNQALSSGNPTSFVDQSKVTFISPDDFKALLGSGANNIYILDVQSASAFQGKHIKGAVNIPLADLEKRSKEIPPARQVVVYGGTELESFQGGVRLFDLNVFSAQVLAGNANLSSGAGLPLEP